MSALTSLDTSQHTTPLSALQLNGNQLLSSAKVAETNAKFETPNVAAEDKETPKVDLNSYYSNVQASNLNSDVDSQPESNAKQNLSNAIATAVSHGMNPQDAVNIRKAKVAYETTMKAEQTSNFELSVE